MTIVELKMALLEIKKMCQTTRECKKCPFYELPDFGCRLDIIPYNWIINEWKVDLNATD